MGSVCRLPWKSAFARTNSTRHNPSSEKAFSSHIYCVALVNSECAQRRHESSSVPWEKAAGQNAESKIKSSIVCPTRASEQREMDRCGRYLSMLFPSTRAANHAPASGQIKESACLMIAEANYKINLLWLLVWGLAADQTAVYSQANILALEPLFKQKRVLGFLDL